MAVALLLMASTLASARTETLRWTHNDSSNVARFTIYYGPSSANYTTVIDVSPLQPDAQGIFTFDIGLPDDAIIYGPGLRWAFMGTCLTFHLAGGDVGMRHMLEQFGPALKLPWTKLEAPELTDELIDRIVSGTQAQCGGSSVKELETLRDNCLIEIMQALARYNYASGATLAKDSSLKIKE